jgi:hypothetical protein
MKNTLCASILVLAVMLTSSACSFNLNNQKTIPAPPSVKERNGIMDEFNTLAKSDDNIQQVIKYMDTNISKVTPSYATEMVLKLETLQKSHLPKLEAKYISNENALQKLIKIYKPGKGIENTDAIQDAELKKLLAETLDKGYRVDTAEGFFYPIIDYSFTEKYSQFVTPDIKEYIGIMSRESSAAPAKDAALVISWDEAFDRIHRQESFIEKYPDSARAADIKALYNRYVTFAILGLNNTPAFDYETKKLNPNIQANYFKCLASSTNSAFNKDISEYSKILKKNDYKLTDEVDAYRKDLLKKYK